MQCHPLSFFTRLPYDTRAIIYSFLEPGLLPPFAPRFTSLAFVLSCRQAKQELEEIAFLGLQKFLAHFERTALYPVKLRSEDTKLRSIVVEVSANAFSGAGWDGEDISVAWKRDVLASVHPLFAQYFDVVRIHFCISSNSSEPPKFDTLADRGRFETAVHDLMRSISHTIKRVNLSRDHANAGGEDFTLETICTYKMELEPTAHVNAKRIRLSWDLRMDVASNNLPVVLNGKLHQAKCTSPDDSVHDSSSTSSGRTPQLVEEWIGEPKLPIFYYLHDQQHLIGEMGLQSQNRWFIPQPWWPNILLNGLENVAAYISSEGFGTPARTGLRGITASDYLQGEVELQNAAWEL
jgi:hypothetical protein